MDLLSLECNGRHLPPLPPDSERPTCPTHGPRLGLAKKQPVGSAVPPEVLPCPGERIPVPAPPCKHRAHRPRKLLPGAQEGRPVPVPESQFLLSLTSAASVLPAPTSRGRGAKLCNRMETSQPLPKKRSSTSSWANPPWRPLCKLPRAHLPGTRSPPAGADGPDDGLPARRLSPPTAPTPFNQ